MDEIHAQLTDKFDRKIWKRFFSMLRKAKLPYIWLAVTLALSLTQSSIALIFPNYMAQMLRGDYRLELLMLVLVVLVAQSVLEQLHTTASNLTQKIIDRNLQRSAVRKVLKIPVYEVERQNPRFFISRITTDTEKMSSMLLQFVVRELPRIYYMVTSVFILYSSYDIRLALATLSTIPLTVLGGWLSGKIRFSKAMKVQGEIARLTGVLAEKIGNLPIIKYYSREDKESADGKELLDSRQKAQDQYAVAQQISLVITGFVDVLPMVICIVVGAVLVLSGEVSADSFAAFYIYSTTFCSYITLHADLWGDIKETQGATCRLAQIMDMAEESGSGKTDPVSGDIEFKNVEFAYGDSAVLRGVTFTAKAGQKTVLVGFSGSGKTTTLNLIEKFYEPAGGAITVGGENIAGWNPRAYRANFTYVPQSAPAMEGTIRQVITYGLGREVSDEDINEALSLAGADGFVRKLGGLDYNVGSGADKLSGGQRQRLCIARALLSDTEYMLLDEATSALDADSAVKLQKALDKKMKGKTIISVTHHLRTALDADKIIMVGEGQVIAEGTHSQLMAECPQYAQLVKSQSGGDGK